MPDPTGFEVRSAGVDDIDAIAELIERAYRGEASRVGWTTEADLLDGQRSDRAEVAAKVSADAGEVLVAVTPEGVVVACCELVLRPRVAYFGMFAVEPRLQSSGLGRFVLNVAEERARERWSATTMEMTVIEQRTELIEWYERRGFRRTGEARPFPYGDVSKGVPQREDLAFVVLVKVLLA